MLKYVYHHCLIAQRHPFCARNNKIITCLLVKIHAHFVFLCKALSVSDIFPDRKTSRNLTDERLFNLTGIQQTKPAKSHKLFNINVSSII